jgi:hypothetical protein
MWVLMCVLTNKSIFLKWLPRQHINSFDAFSEALERVSRKLRERRQGTAQDDDKNFIHLWGIFLAASS